ncbi:F-box/FBD/LRR-repeat protein At1g13570-like [Ipomoea triloba]|uniref:F-box/FBD/LRR-repeat protein At1g13570-like n=1 Tax=Ipomoea triloba TaxID=35885 RepID=UPI00125DDBF5|nr:F-box/FBD/LRR-repeat protein At1g13570-like [Ipomoea triloba]
MGRRRLIKTTRRDLISSLPVEVKHRILECLPTQDTARTALLSTNWNDVWSQRGRLVFDFNFSYRVKQGYFEDKGRTLAGIIDNILLSRAGPIKKFTLDIGNDYQQSHFDRWCLFLSKNGVEELHISFCNGREAGFKLPFCILSCRTIKQLRVEFPIIDLPVNNVGGIFFNVTSLFFSGVEFRPTVNETASSISISIPNLEKLAFFKCRGINKFEISASKLEKLYVRYFVHDVVESRWLAPHLKAIKSLWLCGSSLLYVDASLFANAINLQVLGLDYLSFGCGKQLTVVMQLLQKCPNLYELGIMADPAVCKCDEESTSRLLEDLDGCFIVKDLKMLNTIKIELFSGSTVEILFGWEDDDKEVASRLLEDPDGCLVIQELKMQMLNTIQIESFSGSAFEMFFMKLLLSKSPALERVVILKRLGMNASKVRKIQRKL